MTVLVRELATGRDTTFGNVSDYSWQDAANGQLLALAISADGQAGNRAGEIRHQLQLMAEAR